MQSTTLIFALALVFVCKASPFEFNQTGGQNSGKLLERANSPITETSLHSSRAISQSDPHLDYEDHIFSIESKPDSPLSTPRPSTTDDSSDPPKLHLGKHARPKKFF
ncbi:hypothetical protein DFH28DRAFT_1053059 [Melampsora americana]|nr:hypothetical protein DFH28DRAFT_1053059 [Melampsora americana]